MISVLVAGLGAMGSAIAQNLARRGAAVTAFDAYAPPHAKGSSHGESRIIREAYFEDPGYVPLVRLAYDAWGRLERDTGRRLLHTTGALTLGPRDGALVGGAAESARIHGVAHDLLDFREIVSRYPQLRPEALDAAVYEARGGVLRPEECVRAALEEAVRHGATLRPGERVDRWAATSSGVSVKTSRGRYEADFLVVAAGPWARGLVPELPLTVERQVMTWFEPARNAPGFEVGAFPVFVWETEEHETFYGVPDLGTGLKAARHHGGVMARHPEDLPDEVSDDDVAGVRRFLSRRIPDAAGRLRRAEVCRYTDAPEHRFIIAHHPEAANVFVVSACSGHGFKFASAIGEHVATHLTGGQTSVDLSMFGWPQTT